MGATNVKRLVKKFEDCGFRAVVEDIDLTDRERQSERTGGRLRGNFFTLDVQKDKCGEYFEIIKSKDVTVGILDADRKDRHMLVALNRANVNQKFLMGHDETHLFVAAVDRNVTTLEDAKESLKPQVVRDEQRLKRVKKRKVNKRRNKAFVRQGEWFFLPRPHVKVDRSMILKNEPITRGDNSKPHMVQEMFRQGGESVMVCSRHPQGLTKAEYYRLVKENPAAENWVWRSTVRNPKAYARGKVTHPDHSALCLLVWHEIVMSNESQFNNKGLVFID